MASTDYATLPENIQNNVLTIVCLITPNVSDVMGVIVLASSVCVGPSVSPYHFPGLTDGHTNLNFSMDVKWKDI